MTNQHPIIPPFELVQQWLGEHYGAVYVVPGEATSYVATQAARWGADQELEACVKWVSENCPYYEDGSRPEDKLRAAMRFKPPSLKEQALAKLEAMERLWEASGHTPCDLPRRALEALPE